MGWEGGRGGEQGAGPGGGGDGMGRDGGGMGWGGMGWWRAAWRRREWDDGMHPIPFGTGIIPCIPPPSAGWESGMGWDSGLSMGYPAHPWYFVLLAGTGGWPSLSPRGTNSRPQPGIP